MRKTANQLELEKLEQNYTLTQLKVSFSRYFNQV